MKLSKFVLFWLFMAFFTGQAIAADTKDRDRQVGAGQQDLSGDEAWQYVSLESSPLPPGEALSGDGILPEACAQAAVDPNISLRPKFFEAMLLELDEEGIVALPDEFLDPELLGPMATNLKLGFLVVTGLVEAITLILTASAPKSHFWQPSPMLLFTGANCLILGTIHESIARRLKFEGGFGRKSGWTRADCEDFLKKVHSFQMTQHNKFLLHKDEPAPLPKNHVNMPFSIVSLTEATKPAFFSLERCIAHKNSITVCFEDLNTEAKNAFFKRSLRAVKAENFWISARAGMLYILAIGLMEAWNQYTIPGHSLDAVSVHLVFALGLSFGGYFSLSAYNTSDMPDKSEDELLYSTNLHDPRHLLCKEALQRYQQDFARLEGEHYLWANFEGKLEISRKKPVFNSDYVKVNFNKCHEN